MGLKVEIKDIKEIFALIKESGFPKVDLRIPTGDNEELCIFIDNTTPKVITPQKNEPKEKGKEEVMTPEKLVKAFEGTTQEFNL